MHETKGIRNSKNGKHKVLVTQIAKDEALLDMYNEILIQQLYVSW